MSQQIWISYWNHKICWEAINIRLFSICKNLLWNSIQVPKELFWRTKFFPMTWSAVFSQFWRRSIFKFCGYKLAESERFLKFKSEFIIIGRGCLVLLKFKFKLCKDYVLLVLNFLVLIRYPCVLNNYPSNIRTGNIGGLFRERSLTVLLSV